MNVERARDILAGFKKVRIAIFGDFCLEAHWHVNPAGEDAATGLRGKTVLPGHCRYFLAGAANVCAVAAALEAGRVAAIGAVGDDPFGRELLRMLGLLGVDTGGMKVQEGPFQTLAQVRVLAEEREQNRMNFGVRNTLEEETVESLICVLRKEFEASDAIALYRRIGWGARESRLVEALNELSREFPGKPALCDSRASWTQFRGFCWKLQEREAAAGANIEIRPKERVGSDQLGLAAETLHGVSGRPVFIVRGARGIVARDTEGLHEVPGIQVLRRVEPVRASEAVLSALTCCLATGMKPRESAEFAVMTSVAASHPPEESVPALGAEVLGLAWDTEYVYEPELAEDIRRAAYWEGSEIETCCVADSLPRRGISHAVVDHDGTLSVLHQGWDKVMEAVMIRAILGEEYHRADPALYHRVRHRVREYVAKSAGLQTLVQMDALVSMVRDFGVVPEDRMLDALGYKEMNDRAMADKVNNRLLKLERGDLNIADYTIKGALEFLALLRDRGITLYLISGIRSEDVLREAKMLGYAKFFDGGIYGSSGDASRFSKRLVIEAVIRDNRLKGSDLVCIGDGQVEIRECRRYRGLCIGMATDEVRRHGLNPEKRARLIKAGAHIVAPDFSQGDVLAKLALGP